MEMFTREEAFSFLEKNLEVKNAEERTKTDRKNLLDKIATNMQTHLVFQNLRLLSEEPEKRHRPSLEDIKADLLSGIGGLCFDLNFAAYFLLKAIGFNAMLIPATNCTSVEWPSNHVCVYVHDVEKDGDKFLVDVGTGFPTFRAINLDFGEESPVYADSFLEYKYKRTGTLMRMHRKGDFYRISFVKEMYDGINLVIDGWRRYYYINHERTYSTEGFLSSFEEICTNHKATAFHHTYRVTSFPGGKAVMVINDKTLIENDTGGLEATTIEGGDEGIIAAVRQHFPVIPEDLARKALASWRKSTHEATTPDT